MEIIKKSASQNSHGLFITLEGVFDANLIHNENNKEIIEEYFLKYIKEEKPFFKDLINKIIKNSNLPNVGFKMVMMSIGLLKGNQHAEYQVMLCGLEEIKIKDKLKGF